MQITFESSALSQQLTAASRVLNAKNSYPILDCYLFEVDEGSDTLYITATDNENTLLVSCPIVSFTSAVDATWRRFCIKARTIMDALCEIPAQPVSLTINMQTYEIRGQYANGIFNIMGEAADEFPVAPKLDEPAVSIELTAQMLLADIEGTQFACGDDEIRPVMNGLFFDLGPKQMCVVGTDGHTLVRRTTAVHDGLVLPQTAASFIMPKKTATILRGLLKNDGSVAITFNEKFIQIGSPSFRLRARLIEGRYPNYNAVIPTANPLSAQVDKNDFVPALRRVMTFANKDHALVRLAFGTDNVKMSCQDVDYSMSGEETVPAAFDGRDGFAIGVKGTIVMEVMQHLPREVVISMSEPNRAIIITPSNDEGNTNVLMLVMPMMLD